MKLYAVKSSAVRAARKAGLDEGCYEITEQDGKWGFREIDADTPDQEDAAAPEQESPTVAEPHNASIVESPVKRVWEIADSMPDARRKDVIAACVDQGVAFYTARTQYQKWKQNRAT